MPKHSGENCKSSDDYPRDYDRDVDGVDDNEDNCPDIPNNQADTDEDGQGDECDSDDDGDNVPDWSDNCPDAYDPYRDPDDDKDRDGCLDQDSEDYINSKKKYGTVTGSTIYSTFNQSNVVFLGAYAGWKVNNKLMIGLGGHSLINDYKEFGNNYKSLTLRNLMI